VEYEMAEKYFSPPHNPSLGPSPPGITIPIPSWVRLNHLCTGVGLTRSTMHKWGLVSLAYCRCGAEEQTANHSLVSFSPYYPLSGTLGLATLDDSTVDWLFGPNEEDH